MTGVIEAATVMGAVTLEVGDLDAKTRYYAEGVGLDVMATGPDRVALGRGTLPSLVLRHAPGLRHASRTAAGLFHTAVLFDSREALAAAVYGVATHFPRSFTGSSDHLVSQAFYFDDPEGNGVELYWDRPRSDWTWEGGTVQMSTLPLDPNAFLQQHLGTRAPTAVVAEVGHVHLKVGDIPTAKAFYVDVLGFEITAQLAGQALFVSAGGYHHHIGMNTWESRGAGPRTPALGLGQVAVRVPDLDGIAALADRLRVAGIATRHDGRELAFEDPWRNTVRALVAGA